MTWFSNLPVQRKLGYAMLLTTTGALLLACVVFLAVEYRSYQRDMEHTVATLARLTADNSTAAIAFSDRASATQILDALRAEPQIVSAALYDGNGRLFASFSTSPGEILRAGPATGPARLSFEEKGYVVAMQPVTEGPRRLGTLYLRVSMAQIFQRMRTYVWVVLGVLASSFGLAGLIASRLRDTLARPILELAKTANAVSARQDYSLRARQYGEDELGRLTATFNVMLADTQAAIGALKESEWSHRQLVRALPTAAYMCDAQGLITIFNDAAVELWGRAPEIGLEYWCGSYRIYRPDGTPLPLDECPMAVALREARRVRGVEIIIERPDGTRRNVLPHPEPIRDIAGTVVGIVNMLVDITEQKQADAAIRQLAAIVESSDDAIIGKDLNGIITSWNHGAERLYGYTAAEIIGRPVTLLIPPDRESEEPTILERIRRGERIEHYETVRCPKDGTQIDVSLMVSPIMDETGRIIGASKIARDITARTQQQRQANFLSQLNQQLSVFQHPDEIMRTAAHLIGEYLKTDRCYFCTFSPDASAVTVKEDWARQGFPGISGVHLARDFGTPALWRAMMSGPLGISDKSTHELTRNQGAGYEAVRIAAHATAPLFGEGGELLAVLAVATEQPRHWRKDELGFLENSLARVWLVIERARAQQELQESERRQREAAERLSLAIASAQLGDWSWDAATDLMILSPRTEELYGVPPGTSLTRSAAREALHPDDREAARQELRRSMETRTDYDIEYQVVRPDGTRRWIAAKGRPIYGAGGAVAGMVGVVQDITERKEHAAALQTLADKIESQALLFDATLSNITDLAYYFDLQGRWIYANRPLLQIWDRSLEEISGKSCRELGYPPELAARLEAQVQEVITTKGTVRGETPYASADGQIEDHEYIFNPVLDAQGRVTAVVGTTRLITERKRAERTLRENEAQLRLVTDNAPVLLTRLDRQYRLTFVNRAYAERNRATPEQLIGRRLPEVIGEEAFASFQPYIETAFRGERVEFESKILYQHIGPRWVHAILVPDRNAAGAVQGLLAVLNDTTARKEAELQLQRARDEALAASRAKDDFLAALSHELRTPLNPVLLLASDAANNADLPPAIRADFEMIRKNVDLEARLIDDLLDLTRIARGKLRLEEHRCNLQLILKDAAANVQSDLREKHQHLEFDFAAQKSLVWGDSVRLQQIFWNVLKNAVKFTPHGGRIEVQLRENARQDKVTVRITDSGIGLLPQEIERIFQAFTQGDHADPGAGPHRFGGLGLGLAISRMLVELHHGQIVASSAGRDQGSTFEIQLPLYVEEGRHSTPPFLPTTLQNPDPAAAAGLAVPAPRQRILLVEDHAPTRQTLQQLLRNREYLVSVASSAAEAQRLAQTNDFDLIISDVGLPDRTGYELMADLRVLHPRLSGIALSGYGMEEDLNRSRAAGFAIHLVKPVTIGMLVEAIARLPLPVESEQPAPPPTA